MNKQELFAADTVADNELIPRILRGDKNLYAVIVRRYNQRLYRIGMSIINDDAEVEDIMQAAYINAYIHLAQFSFTSTFSTWLTRILINESLQRLKKRERSINMTEDVMDNQMYQQRSADFYTPAAKMLNTELKIILEKSIRQLPEKYRTVFIMREIEGMNIAETKECLDISETNVKVRLNRAKALLKIALGSHYKNEELLHFHLHRCNKMVNGVINMIESGIYEIAAPR